MGTVAYIMTLQVVVLGRKQMIPYSLGVIALKAQYVLTSVKGGAQSQCLNAAAAINATVHRIRAPSPLTEAQCYFV